MLYDPKWEGVSITGFIGWLETKDPRASYPFWECEGRCLVGQYMADMGIPWTGAPDDPMRGNWGNSSFVKTARQIFGEGTFDILTAKPHTFGAALKRCRALRDR